MIRLLTVLLLAFAVVSARAADALILIRHDRAGPNLRMGAYTYPDWLLWPPEGAPNSENGLLSILSGLDWEGDPDDLRFEGHGPLAWRSLDFERLSSTGYLAARSRKLGYGRLRVVADRAGGVEGEALLLGVGAGGPLVGAAPYKAALPRDGLVLSAALSWDDVASIASRVSGRTLVLEFPPQPGQRCTRFWEFGNGWPARDLVPTDPGLRVPGLIHLRDSLDLLRDPGRFRWREDVSKTWGGANRWLDHGSRVSPFVLLGLSVAAGWLFVLGLFRAASEQSSPWTRLFIRALLLAPAADTLSGNLARVTGLDSWTTLLVCCELGLVGLAAALTAWIGSRTPSAHTLFATFLMGACVVCFCDPVWSDFSSVFRSGTHEDSATAVGLWIGYLTGTFAFAGSLGKAWIWIRRAAGIAVVIAACVAAPWWRGSGVDSVALTAVPFAAADQVCSGMFLAVLALLPTGVERISEGVSWRPDGLIHNLREVASLNGADWISFLVSPGMFATVALTGVSVLFGNRFLFYRFRHLVREDPNRTTLAYAALGTACFGLLHPEYLPTTLVLVVGAAMVVVHEAVG